VDKPEDSQPMNNADEGVIEAARAIRPHLNDLVGPATAEFLDRRIVDQLTGPADRTHIASRLRALLEERQHTAWFLGRVLSDRPLYRPPYHQPTYHRDIVSPAGDPGIVVADRYACPQGDYVWYRPELGTPVPDCPTHHILLTRSERAG
jgi:hypothetical protein